MRAWEAFWTLAKTRNGNGWSPDLISLQSISALHVVGIRLSSWEAEAVLEMDAVWMGAWLEKNKRKDDPADLPEAGPGIFSRRD